jgi:hypothetical protein
MQIVDCGLAGIGGTQFQTPQKSPKEFVIHYNFRLAPTMHAGQKTAQVN